MSDRVAVPLLAALTLLGLWVAPWAAYNRETGARGTVTLLPNRVFDFTGRTEFVAAPGQWTLLVLCVLALGAVIAGAWLRRRPRLLVWLVAGVILVAANGAALDVFGGRFEELRVDAALEQLDEAIDDPRSRYDVPALEALQGRAPEQPLAMTVAEARDAGFPIRRLPFESVSMGLAAFLCFLTGSLAIAFGVRLNRRADRWVQRAFDVAAVPATSIVLALLAAAVVILALQPTPVGSDVTIADPFMGLVGRLDTLWFAYYTLFANSLGTLEGFAEALSFATPLLFTGLAVGFGFRAGLFNIGAPGQMVLGALGAMFVGIYLPGPTILVLPATILAAALGGAAWGAIPGWLKARFGAHEVINTILLNFIASSLLLFVLSSSPVFASAALRMIAAVGIVAAALLLLLLLRPVRRVANARPRRAFAVVGVALLVVLAFAGWPRPGDAPVTVNLPFKAPGSEPKSVELSEAARLPQFPALFGLQPEEMIGAQQVQVNAALWAGLAGAALVLAFGGALRRLRSKGPRLAAALAAGGALFALGAAFGWTGVAVAVPPTKLNAAFLIAVGAAVFMYLFLWRTRWGFELRAVGLAPKAAEYGGASIARNTVLAMAISGALAGLSATHYVMGGALEDFALRQSLPTNDGFDGIAVALLGANNPVGIVFASFLFGVMKNGGSILNITFPNLTRDVVNMILALVVLFIAARGFLPERITDPLKRAAARGEGPAASDHDEGRGR